MKGQDAERWAKKVLEDGDHNRYRDVREQLGKWTSKRHDGISAVVNTVGFCFMLQAPVMNPFSGVTGPMQN